MTPQLPEYLAELYRLEELEGWRLLARHLELTDGFSFVVVLAPDDVAIAYLRSRLPEIVGSARGAVCRVAFDPTANVGSLAESLLELRTAKSTRLIWVDTDPVDPERIPARDEAWRNALARLNRYRNSLQARFHCTLVLAGSFSLQPILREAAPDLWSVRSAVFRIEPVDSARVPDEFIRQFSPERADFEDIGLSGDPDTTLAEAEKLRGKPGRELLVAQLLRRAGRQAYRLLNWELAIRCLQDAYSLEETHGGDPALRYHIANDLALVFHQVAQWDRALHYSQRALEIAEQHFGPNHTNTAAALSNLAVLLQATGRLAEAEPLLRRALAIDESNLGPDHSNVATRLSNLGLLLQATGRLAEAEPLLRRALAIEEKNLRPEHPSLATRLNNLGSLLLDTGRSAEAEPLLRRALAIDEKSFGPDHPKAAIRLNNLAVFLRATGRLAEAEPLLRRALAIDEKSFGPNHPNISYRLNNLGVLLQEMDRLAEAEPLLRHALVIDEKSLGPDHPTIANRLNNLGVLLINTSRLAEAEPLMHRGVEILSRFGRQTAHEHPGLRNALANYRHLLEAMHFPPEEIDRRLRAAQEVPPRA
jgi:tetratricopeptide (TPR) repeat protein